MKVICQSCGQVLPKTILTCPNCGGKTFSPQNPQTNQNTQLNQNNSGAGNPSHSMHPLQYNVPPTQQLSPQSLPTNQLEQQTVQAQPQTATPQTPYQGYVPPVAPPLPVQPQTSFAQPPQPPQTAQNIERVVRHIEPALPPVYRKPLKPAYQMRYSGLIRRGFALVFDMVLLGILVSLAWQQLRPVIHANFNFTLNETSLGIASSVVYLLYVAFFTSRSRQATIGKMLVGLWVYDMNGQRIGFWHSFIREILKLLLLPFAFLLWFTARKQTLADLMARTVVLYDPS